MNILVQPDMPVKQNIEGVGQVMGSWYQVFRIWFWLTCPHPPQVLFEERGGEVPDEDVGAGVEQEFEAVRRRNWGNWGVANATSTSTPSWPRPRDN